MVYLLFIHRITSAVSHDVYSTCSEQICRSENIRESQQMSIQRGVDLHDLDLNGPGHTKSPVVRRRKDPPLPPAKKEQLPTPPKVVVCTSMFERSFLYCALQLPWKFGQQIQTKTCTVLIIIFITINFTGI